MNSKNVNYSIAGYSVIEDIASGVIAAVSAFFEKVGKERENIRLQAERRREMQSETHRDMISSLPLEEKLRLGMYRFMD